MLFACTAQMNKWTQPVTWVTKYVLLVRLGGGNLGQIWRQKRSDTKHGLYRGCPGRTGCVILCHCSVQLPPFPLKSVQTMQVYYACDGHTLYIKCRSVSCCHCNRNTFPFMPPQCNIHALYVASTSYVAVIFSRQHTLQSCAFPLYYIQALPQHHRLHRVRCNCDILTSALCLACQRLHLPLLCPRIGGREGAEQSHVEMSSKLFVISPPLPPAAAKKR